MSFVFLFNIGRKECETLGAGCFVSTQRTTECENDFCNILISARDSHVKSMKCNVKFGYRLRICSWIFVEMTGPSKYRMHINFQAAVPHSNTLTLPVGSPCVYRCFVSKVQAYTYVLQRFVSCLRYRGLFRVFDPSVYVTNSLWCNVRRDCYNHRVDKLIYLSRFPKIFISY